MDGDDEVVGRRRGEEASTILFFFIFGWKNGRKAHAKRFAAGK
jgi:hypothetical protein